MGNPPTVPSDAGIGWGPSHQHLAPPLSRRPSLLSTLAGLLALALLLSFLRAWLDPAAGNVVGWALRGVLILAAAKVLLMLVVAVTTRAPCTPIRPADPQQDADIAIPVSIDRSALFDDPVSAALDRICATSAGAYLGQDTSGAWLHADPESAVMVLGPPRSGKTSAVMIPALMACAGAAVSTSTKPDVMEATLPVRSRLGQVWLFDPGGEQPVPSGVRRLGWSPVAGADSWDRALLLARAMTAAGRAGAGTTNEGHWAERASALLAPLLYAANLASSRSKSCCAGCCARTSSLPSACSRTTTPRSPSTCWAASSAPSRASARASSAPRPARSPPTTPTPRAPAPRSRTSTRSALRRAPTRSTSQPPSTARRCAHRSSSACWSRSATRSTTAPAMEARRGRRCCGCSMSSRTPRRSTTCPRSSPRPGARGCRCSLGFRTFRRHVCAGARTPPTAC